MTVTLVDTGARPDRFDALARSLAEIRPGVSYYAATLLKTDRGEILGFVSRWAGLSEEYSLDKGIEMRRAVPVDAEKFSQLWEEIDQGWITVNCALDG